MYKIPYPEPNINSTNCKEGGIVVRDAADPHSDSGLQILPKICPQLFFQSNQPLRKIFGCLIGCLILIQIFTERLYSHVAPIRHKICNGSI
jgi:hypothetical protein